MLGTLPLILSPDRSFQCDESIFLYIKKTTDNNCYLIIIIIYHCYIHVNKARRNCGFSFFLFFYYCVSVCVCVKQAENQFRSWAGRAVPPLVWSSAQQAR